MFPEGFRFGMLLQIAVGPVCLFVFQTATSAGFTAAERGVLGVTLADALFIAAALLGIGTLLERRPRLGKYLQRFGATVLFLFGLNTLREAFATAAKIPIFSGDAFADALLLTLSNPLPILFWSGVLSAKIREKELSQSQAYLFGAGALAATPCFLSLVTAAGCLTNAFLPPPVIRVLTGCVGVLLMGLGIQIALRTR